MNQPFDLRRFLISSTRLEKKASTALARNYANLSRKGKQLITAFNNRQAYGAAKAPAGKPTLSHNLLEQNPQTKSFVRLRTQNNPSYYGPAAEAVITAGNDLRKARGLPPVSVIPAHGNQMQSQSVRTGNGGYGDSSDFNYSALGVFQPGLRRKLDSIQLPKMTALTGKRHPYIAEQAGTLEHEFTHANLVGYPVKKRIDMFKQTPTKASLQILRDHSSPYSYRRPTPPQADNALKRSLLSWARRPGARTPQAKRYAPIYNNHELLEEVMASTPNFLGMQDASLWHRINNAAAGSSFRRPVPLP